MSTESLSRKAETSTHQWVVGITRRNREADESVRLVLVILLLVSESRAMVSFKRERFLR